MPQEAVSEVVRRQADTGIDVISDGEFGKAISWAQYALFRLGGFERRPFRAGANPSRAASIAPGLRSSTPISTLATGSRP